MSLVMDNNFLGAPGDSFAGDAVYSFVVGSSASLVASHYGVALRFPAATQRIVQESFTSVTGPRVFSRIYRINGTPTATSDILQLRATAGGAAHKAQIGSTGRLSVVSSTGSQSLSAAALPVGTEFRVVYTVNAAGTLFSAAIYPNITSTTPTETISVATTATAINALREGFITATGLGSGVTLDLAWPQDDNASDPGLRKYVYATVDKTSFIVPELVGVTVTDENMPAGTKTYKVNFGDGTTVGPQAGASFTHTYTAAGAYDIVPTVDVT